MSFLMESMWIRFSWAKRSASTKSLVNSYVWPLTYDCVCMCVYHKHPRSALENFVLEDRTAKCLVLGNSQKKIRHNAISKCIHSYPCLTLEWFHFKMQSKNEFIHILIHDESNICHSIYSNIFFFYFLFFSRL